jgi:RHS repeat-associated protein
MKKIILGQSPIYIFVLSLLSTGMAFGQNVPNQETQPAGSVTNFTVPPDLPSEGIKFNYTRSYSPMVPITNSQDVSESSPAGDVKISTTYRDGFNRGFQTIIRNYTNNANKHLVVPIDTRTQTDQFSYLPYATAYDNSINTDPNAFYKVEAFDEQKFFYSNLYPNEGYTPFSRSEYISDANQRTSKSYAPGKSQVGQGRGAMTKNIANNAGIVRLWTLNSSGVPESSGYYPVDILYGRLSTSSDGAEVTTFLDKDGHVIYQQEYQSNTAVPGVGVVPVYGTTYNVYDDLGHLRYTIPPLATAAFGGGTLSSTLLDNLCYQYNYDEKGQLTRKKLPGKAEELYVYDKLGRQVLYRDGNLAAAGKWTFTIYDKKGRVLCTGLYQTSTTQQTLRSYFYDSNSFTPSDLFYYQKNYDLFQQYPGTITGAEILAYNYYDNYNIIDPAGTLWNTFATNQLQVSELMSTPGAETPGRGYNISTLPTGSKMKILPTVGVAASQTGDWRETVIYYDEKGRPIYNISRDLYQNIAKHNHYVAGQYDFAGRSLVSKHISENNNSIDGTHKELTRNYYDALTGALTQTQHKLDNGVWNILALYTYDELGRVKRKVLGNYGEVRDFSYSIRGQLEGINPVYTLTGNKEGESRSFGEMLRYDYGFTVPRYDGKIAGMLWRGSTAANNNAYGYTYDPGGRISGAEYRRWEPAGGIYLTDTWRKDLRDYTLSNMTYDLNGNIKTMKQRGLGIVSGNVVPVDIDNLTYDYNSSANTLSRVTDAATINYGNSDFQNTNGNNTDYAYDVNGNLTSDQNKQSTTTYNYLNKPDLVTVGSAGNEVSYGYDALGAKVLYRIKEGGVTKLTDYIGNFVYEGNVLKYVQTAEGRAVYDANSHLFKEEFFVKDHLENIRSVVDVYTYPIQQYLASYEIASANLEGLFFDHIDEVRDDKPGSIDPNDNQAGNLNGDDPDRRIGTSMLLKVMAGDKVELNVNSFYESYDENNQDAVPVEEMMQSIITTLTGGAGGFEGSESHDTKLVNDVFSNGNYQQYNDLLSVQYDPTRPRAYLNYVLFDEGMNIVRESSGAFQANGLGGWAPIGTITPMVIPANGYLAVYLSNGARLGCGTCNDVFFDQLVVRMTTGKLREESHYYPFGLPIGSMGSAAAGFMPNKDKYQSNEFNKDLGLNLMDFHNRQFDPQLGRFLSIDPMAAATVTMSPYVAMDNNPVSVIDPLGLIGEVFPTFNVQTPRVSFYMPFLVMSNYGNTGDKQSAAGQALDAAMAKASSENQKMALYFQALGRGGATAQGSSGSPNNSGNASLEGMPNVLGEAVITASRSEGKSGPGFFGKIWSQIKSFVNRIEIKAEGNVSVGVQAGFDVEVAGNSIGGHVNLFSVDVFSYEDPIDGVDNAKYNWMGKDFWMTIKQSAEGGIGAASISVEREAQSPSNGGAFFNDKLTIEKSLGIEKIGLGVSETTVIPLGGLTTGQPPVREETHGISIGGSARFLLGVDFNININLRPE